MLKIGILNLQGSVIEHTNILNKIECVEPIKIKYKEELTKIDGLIIPGGESTTMAKLLSDFDLLEPLKKKIKGGMPVWGTCAGMVLLAKKIAGVNKSHLATMDIEIKRNAYGNQLDSFIATDIIPEISDKPISMPFIRAPYILNVGTNVRILKKLNGKIVAAKEKNMLVTSFHPELTDDTRVHRYFIKNFF